MTGSLLAAFKRNTSGTMSFLIQTMARILRLRKEDAVDIADRIRHGVTTRIETCTTCGTRLPLRIPRHGERGINWQCTVCGYRYYGLLDEQSDEEARDNVREAEQEQAMPSRRLRGSKGTMSRGLTRQAQPVDPPQTDETARHPLDSTILAYLLDENREVVGSAFLIRSRNISPTGIALMHSQEIQPGSLIQVELLDVKYEAIKATLRVLRCSRMEDHYEIAGAFLEPIDVAE
jgi:predicted  nucleic acid-binding Zn-ribbon protein